MELCLKQWGLFLLLMPAIAGCAFIKDSTRIEEKKRTWVDVGEINKDIVKKAKQNENLMVSGLVFSVIRDKVMMTENIERIH